MKQNVQHPYRGEKPYVFLSYSHKNMDNAMGIVHHMQSDGFRIWYDEGIDPGSEWDENIASHVEQCGYFIALLSHEYLSSSNCKDELNYARDLDKPRLLIYLDNIQLPGGMRMRLSRLQAIHRYKYSDPDQFYKKLYESQGIDNCRNSDYLGNVGSIGNVAYEKKAEALSGLVNRIKSVTVVNNQPIDVETIKSEFPKENEYTPTPALQTELETPVKM